MLLACPRCEETVVHWQNNVCISYLRSFLKEYSDEYQRFPAVAETIY
jgi:transcription initiation factor IIE alpha subunit